MRRGQCVGFLGPDGSGKTTVIKALRAALEERGITSDRHHWRARWSGPIVKESDGRSDPHSKQARGWLGSMGQLCLWFLLSWLSWLRWVSPALLAGKWVICDRVADDILVDPRRYRNGLSFWIRRLWTRVVPRPSVIIVLGAPPSVLFARKPEIPFDDLVIICDAYSALDGVRYFHVNVDRKLSAIMVDIFKLVKCEG